MTEAMAAYLQLKKKARAPRVLLVDDNAFNRELVTDLLEPEGYDVSNADSAARGLHLAQTTKPDLILMDIAMPGIDGIRALKMLKSNPATRAIPVVVLSAHAMRADKAAAFEAECAAYMTKPINTRTFVSEIAAYLAGDHTEKVEA